MEIEYKDNFKASEGQLREVEVTVINDELPLPNQVFVLTYGVMTTKNKEGKTSKAGRWALSRVIVENGAQVYRTVYGMDPKKLCEVHAATVYGAMGATADDYAFDADWEDDFWSQKYTPVTDDVWSMDEFDDVKADLIEARGVIEEALERADENGKQTQDDKREVSQKLNELLENTFGGNMKLLGSFLRGSDDAVGNMPFIEKLGRGANALADELKLGRMSDDAYAIFPQNLLSGKGVDDFSTKSLKLVAEKGYSSKNPTVEMETYVVRDKDVSLPTKESAGGMLRAIARWFFGIHDAVAKSDGEHVITLGDVAELVEAEALTRVSTHRQLYGKRVNTYDKDEREAALTAFGSVQCTNLNGVNLFADAVERVLEAVEAEDYAEAIAPSFGTKGNMLLRYAAAHCERMIASNAKSNQIREAQSEAAELAESDEPVAEDKLEQLDPMAQAAYYYQCIAKREMAGDIATHLKAMFAQKAPENRKKVAAA